MTAAADRVRSIMSTISKGMLLIAPDCPLSRVWFPGEALCLVDDERNLEVHESVQTGLRRYLVARDGRIIAAALYCRGFGGVVLEAYAAGQSADEIAALRQAMQHGVRRDFRQSTWLSSPDAGKSASCIFSPLVSDAGLAGHPNHPEHSRIRGAALQP